MTDKQIADRLKEIKDQVKDQISEAKDLLRFVKPIIKERAKAYWLPQIETALDNDHNWLGNSMFTMEDTIEDLDCGEEDEDDFLFEED